MAFILEREKKVNIYWQPSGFHSKYYQSAKLKLPEEPRLQCPGGEERPWVLPCLHWVLDALAVYLTILAIQWTIGKITDDPDVLLED